MIFKFLSPLWQERDGRSASIVFLLLLFSTIAIVGLVHLGRWDTTIRKHYEKRHGLEDPTCPIDTIQIATDTMSNFLVSCAEHVSAPCAESVIHGRVMSVHTEGGAGHASHVICPMGRIGVVPFLRPDEGLPVPTSQGI